MNTQQLENRIKRLHRKVKGMIIDFDDPNYAIYKRGKREHSTNFLKENIIPANITARDYELEKTGYNNPEHEATKREIINLLRSRKGEKILEDDEPIKNESAEEILKLPIETNKQTHVNDPNYLIYKLIPEAKGKDPKFEPYNKAAKEYEHEMGRYPYDPQKQKEMIKKELQSRRSDLSNKSS